jgi:hypothetical protein
VTAPPTVTAEGVALIDRESRAGLWEDGFVAHPAVRISKPHRSAEHTCEVGEIRMYRLVGPESGSIAAWGRGHFRFVKTL